MERVTEPFDSVLAAARLGAAGAHRPPDDRSSDDGSADDGSSDDGSSGRNRGRSGDH